MLNKLQRLKWPGKSKSAAEKKAAPSAIDKQETGKSTDRTTTDTTAELAAKLANPSEKIRISACLQLQNTDQLLEIYATDKNDKVKLTAARQYAKQLPAGTATIQTLDSHAKSSSSRHLARLITAHHNDVAIRNHGLSLFDSDADLLDIAVETRFHETRQIVAGRIRSIAVVDKCWRQIKSKDKIVARELKQRLSEQSQKIEAQKKQQEQVTKISDEMQKLAQGAWSPTLAHRYELFAKMWSELDYDIAPEREQIYETYRATAFSKVSENLSVQKHHDDCEQLIASFEKAALQFNDATLATLTAVIDAAKQKSSELKNDWQKLSESDSNTHPISKLHQANYSKARSNTDRELSNATHTLSAFQELRNSKNTDLHVLQKYLKKLQDLQRSFEQLSHQPLYANELPQLITTVQQRIKQCTQENNELRTAIHKQLGSLNSAICCNRWGPAKSIHERLVKKVDRLSATEKKQYTEKLQRLEKKLNDLGDWKQFATEPKLASLCESMEKVPSLSLNPKEQADRIKDLQSQWKSMGANPAQNKYWPRFKSAADLAYAPCAKYFAAKKSDKEAKLARRAEICEILDAYIEKSDWENPDSKLVEKTVHAAKTEWRNSQVFDRKATSKLEDRFTAILATINGKLEPSYAAAVAEKNDLIEKVKALGAGEINQHCINQVKRLQSMWRVTPATRRADDQKLWTEFNEACSTIYNTHRSKQRQQYAASVEHVTRAKQIIGELKGVEDSTEQIDEKAIQQLQDEFQSLPEFPERDQKHLLRNFNRAVESLDQHRQKLTTLAQSQEIQRLHSNANLCDQLEALVCSPSDNTSREIEKILAHWDSGEATDKGKWRKAINLRKDTIVAHLDAGTQPDYEANTNARRLLCIENEILPETETPAEDKQLRMQYQLEKLQQGLSAAAADSVQQQATELEIRWLTEFPADPQLRDKLDTRFNSAKGS